jgi:hypothetical protein
MSSDHQPDVCKVTEKLTISNLSIEEPVVAKKPVVQNTIEQSTEDSTSDNNSDAGSDESESYIPLQPVSPPEPSLRSYTLNLPTTATGTELATAIENESKSPSPTSVPTTNNPKVKTKYQEYYAQLTKEGMHQNHYVKINLVTSAGQSFMLYNFTLEYLNWPPFLDGAFPRFTPHINTP